VIGLQYRGRGDGYTGRLMIACTHALLEWEVGTLQDCLCSLKGASGMGLAL
jgi:hypothetical protein